MLAAPFSADEIEWRVGKDGISGANRIWCQVFAYVTNRAIMNRLDDVMGPENWKNEFREWKGTAQLCGLSLRINREWITKWDGAPDTDFEAVKGGLSDAMKRAAVAWGIGRYLYYCGSNWGQNITTERPDNTVGWNRGSVKGKSGSVTYYWQPPELPEWALPQQKGVSK